ncbi:MAG: hypothetical protein IPK26_30440 [Planctomycetes bacterium]|nr:hypothetical protein [Planctomycetota bacterium]
MIRSLVALLLFPFAVLAQAGKDPAPADKGQDKAKTEKVEFEKHIWPILEKNCLECHRAPFTDKDGKTKKPKGGVILETKENLMGGKKGKLLKPKDSAASLLYTSITLAADDEDRMPPAKKGDPLPKEQTDLIKKWIDDGADFGKWTGKKEGDDKDKKDKGADKDKPKDGDKPAGGTGGKKGELLQQLGRNLQPASPDQLAGLASVHAHATSVGDDSPLLEVHFTGHEDSTGDQAVAALLPLHQHIAILRLGRTQITDAACAHLGRLGNLVQLDLRETAVGDAGVQQLAACKNLASLNLFGTRVGNAGVAALAALPQLQQLYLWQTEVAAATVQELRSKLPAVQVVTAAELPEPMAEGAAAGRRRAR